MKDLVEKAKKKEPVVPTQGKPGSYKERMKEKVKKASEDKNRIAKSPRF